MSGLSNCLISPFFLADIHLAVFAQVEPLCSRSDLVSTPSSHQPRTYASRTFVFSQWFHQTLLNLHDLIQGCGWWVKGLLFSKNTFCIRQNYSGLPFYSGPFVLIYWWHWFFTQNRVSAFKKSFFQKKIFFVFEKTVFWKNTFFWEIHKNRDKKL